MAAIMTIDEPRPRGTVMGKQVSGPAIDRGRAFPAMPALRWLRRHARSGLA
jgi:hypothetical protein